MDFKNRWVTISTVLILSGLFCIVSAQDTLIAPLRPLQPYLGKTWRGTPENPQPGKTMQDVSHWERALNGKAIRILHSINDGEYGGESILYWNKEKKTLEYYYFTTAGFNTHGTMTIEGQKFISHEYVTGNENGITEVESTAEFLPDGRLHSSSRYLKNGEWVPGHAFYYVEDPTAKVVFK